MADWHFSLHLGRDGALLEQPPVPGIRRRFEQDGIIYVLSGRIYYLEDLYQSLGLAPQKTPDAAIIHLYQTQKPEALSRLEGEFALAIGDRRRQRILLARDNLGSYPLYWTQDNRGFWVSSSLRFLAQETQRAINGEFIGKFLCFSFAFTELPFPLTYFEGIERILPGQILELSLGRPPRLWASPDLLDSLTPIADITPAEASQGFKSLLDGAVGERLQFGAVGAHLSGGLDSSTVAHLAHQRLAPQPLTTLSLVYELPTLVQETDYIRLMLERETSLRAELIGADSLLDFQWFERPLPEHDEPYAGLFHLAIETRLAERAAALGLTTVLTGCGAELVAEANPYILADLLARGQWSQVFTLTQQQALANHQSFWSIFSQFALFPHLPVFLRHAPGTLLNQGRGGWPNLKSFEITPWINPKFAQNFQLFAFCQDLFRHIQDYPTEKSMDRFALSCMAGNWANWHLNNPLGIHVAQPFLDPRVIQFCWALPRELRTSPGRRKPLLLAALKDDLPPPILNRKYKANFNEPYWRGLNQNLPYLTRLVDQSSRVYGGALFDAAILKDCLNQHAVGVGDIASGSHLVRSLSLLACGLLMD